MFSGLFTDSNGEVSLVIEDNEWKAFSNSWDVEVKGQTITIREAHKVVHLVLRVDPPKTVIVEKLNMSLGGIRFEANGDFLKVTQPNGSISELTSCIFDNCLVGMAF
ncbi:MAG TPA: hypothetical protein DHV59_01025 [Oxalobacteraceae bacterium]|nr:hypothetical protein [Oxalobacteraceae bacterium]